MTDFSILKNFNVTIHPPNAPKDWIKCNSDGSAQGVPGLASCGGIYRNANAEHLGSFFFNIGVGSSFQVELIGAMLAIEIADSMNWRKFWLETDSKMVVQALQNPQMVPWKLRNRWLNCLFLSQSMSFMLTHIYREGNHCADKLANLGLNAQQFTWLDYVHIEMATNFNRNRLSLPCFRFVH